MSNLSRASSTGSLAGLPKSMADSGAAPPHNDVSVASEDEDSDGRSTSLSYKERRREAHTQVSA